MINGHAIRRGNRAGTCVYQSDVAKMFHVKHMWLTNRKLSIFHGSSRRFYSARCPILVRYETITEKDLDVQCYRDNPDTWNVTDNLSSKGRTWSERKK